MLTGGASTGVGAGVGAKIDSVGSADTGTAMLAGGAGGGGVGGGGVVGEGGSWKG